MHLLSLNRHFAYYTTTVTGVHIEAIVLPTGLLPRYRHTICTYKTLRSIIVDPIIYSECSLRTFSHERSRATEDRPTRTVNGNEYSTDIIMDLWPSWVHIVIGSWNGVLPPRQLVLGPTGSRGPQKDGTHRFSVDDGRRDRCRYNNNRDSRQNDCRRTQPIGVPVQFYTRLSCYCVAESCLPSPRWKELWPRRWNGQARRTCVEFGSIVSTIGGVYETKTTRVRFVRVFLSVRFEGTCGGGEIKTRRKKCRDVSAVNSQGFRTVVRSRLAGRSGSHTEPGAISAAVCTVSA